MTVPGVRLSMLWRMTVCEDYYYAHMLNIDGKLEAAKEFGKSMIEK
ncbi:hypothetical protein [Butyrivibrio sp. VCB2006]|nr:hypothetical protein [Butyrivibrio sp. VCB2006]